MQSDAVLDAGSSDVVQAVRPFADLGEEPRRVLRNQNVARVSAVHHPLCEVNPTASYIQVRVNVFYSINRPAMDSHSELERRMSSQGTAKLNRGAQRSLWVAEEDKGHTVPRWQANQSLRLRSRSELIQSPDYLLKLL